MPPTGNVADFDPFNNVSPDRSDAEWQARVDLAAGHRLVALFGWSNLIFNHFCLRVPDAPEEMLVKPNDLMFEEVTASSLVRVPLGSGSLRNDIGVQAAGYNIHCGVLEGRPELNASLHIHSDAGMAVAAQRDGLLPLGQTSLRFYKHIGSHAFEGFASEAEERARISKDLGPFKALLMLNHGLLTAGKSVCEALVLMKALVTSCEVQLRLQSSNVPYVIPSEDVCLSTAKLWNEPRREPKAEWPALIRMLDRLDTSYKS